METKNPDQNVPLGTASTLEDLHPSEPVFTPLLMDERDRLVVILKDPAFVKAWRNAHTVKPGVFIANPTTLAGTTGLQLANNRFHEIRGWEMFVAALVNQAKEPVVKRKAVLEEYPNAGTIEAEAERIGGPVEPRKMPGQVTPPKVPVKGPMPTPKIANTSKIRKP